MLVPEHILVYFEIWDIRMDMSPVYALVCSNLMPRAAQIIDKFHVMKYVYEAVLEVRVCVKKELANGIKNTSLRACSAISLYLSFP